MHRLCLNMIVKNEAAIIERCLAAAAPYISCYVICDTGSTDATRQIIKRFFDAKGIPGTILDIPFHNFEQARNQALEAARQSPHEFDRILLCDADMELHVENPEFRALLNESVYMLVQRASAGNLEYENIRIVARDLPCRYVGVTHEYLDIGATPRHSLGGVWYLDYASGSSRASKFARDIALLKGDLAAHPDNTRSLFYLANSYFDHGDMEEAITQYTRRAGMEGWSEEVFYSLYRIGKCHLAMGREAQFIQTMLDAYERFPHRAEPLHELAQHYQKAGKHRLTYHFAEIGSRMLKPAGALFIEPEVYEWRLLDLLSVSLYYVNRRVEGRDLCKRLLNIVPESQRPRVFKNLQWFESSL